jgi:hypothetical protein
MPLPQDYTPLAQRVLSEAESVQGLPPRRGVRPSTNEAE